MANEDLIKRVKERFGVGVPQWRTVVKGGRKINMRVLSKQEKTEKKAIEDWLSLDTEFWNAMDVYFSYCDILVRRGYGSAKDREFIGNHIKNHPLVARNLIKCQLDYIYHDMCCDPATILGEGHEDGYWIYLDKRYLDISNMASGKAILNLDEVWAVVDNTLKEWQNAFHDREAHYLEHLCYKCDRCGKEIYEKRGSRFDMYENLLHCKECAETCTHFSKKGKK